MIELLISNQTSNVIAYSYMDSSGCVDPSQVVSEAILSGRTFS